MRLNELTIKQAADGIRKKEFSVTELVSNCLRAASQNKDLNAYLEVFDDTLEEAKKADSLLNRHHELPPLFGIPLAIKDNILIEGKHCTAGSKILENYIASYDATVIKKLKNHGAILLGKTNLDEFAMGSSTENSAFNHTKNPHDVSRVPGGSSGGSAAAVSANMCIAALGSDTGGSIRQPAAFCGIVGLKPTYGAISRHGLIAMASSLDQIGPMTKSVEDAALLFDAIKGKDIFDATSLEIQETKKEPAHFSLKNIRIGVPEEYFTQGLDNGVEKIIRSILRKMQEAGAELKKIVLPHMPYALATYYIIISSEISANIARYDSIRYGVRENSSPKNSTDNLYDVYAKSRAQGFGPEVKRRLLLGTYALSAGYYDAYYLKAQKVRQLIREDFVQTYKNVDVIAGPTTPTPAFRIGEKIDDPLKMYLGDIYTAPVNLAGLPALSLPAGFVKENNKNLPVGLQLIGNWFEERKLLKIAGEVEKILSQ